MKWQVSPDGTNWTDVSGATSTSLTLTKPSFSQSGNQYRAVFTNSRGNATSNPATLQVAQKNLTISGAVANNKPYDGTTNATVNFSGANLSGVESGDTVTIESSGYSANFDNKNVGNNKAVTVTGVTLGGADAGNYTVSQPSGMTANITAKQLIGSFTADNKQYDGNNSATVLSRSVSGVVGSEVVTLNGGTATFNDRNVGTGKTVTLSGASLSGAGAGNYVLASGAITTTANITAKQLTVSATGVNKQYDGNADATVSLSTTG